MRISQNWLHDYINFSFTPEELSDRLSMLGVEIEGTENLGAKYENIVVGKVLDRQRHPHADRLSVCSVSVGTSTLQIVCGAPNVAAGQKVAVGLSGASIPKNQHDPEGKPFVLSNVKIRGVDSFGMICSAYELDLGDDSDGILVLDPKAKAGMPLAAFLGLDDVVLDIEITANRPDLLSHFGVAREIGALTGKLPKLPVVKLKESRELAGNFIRVVIHDRENCKRFAVRAIRNVKIGPSPKWMQDRLVAIGLRPRNNVVDVTNYVMYECGQPLHAFDYNLIEGGVLHIRQAKHSVSMKTLDGKERTAPAGAVMVCDARKEISIAGIMGGANTEINDSTTDIILESAYWNPSSIRRTRKALMLTTDASQRFERGADPNATDFALHRAAQLIAELSGGTVLRGTVDDYKVKAHPKNVTLRSERVNAILGTDLTKSQVSKLLRSLGLVEKPGKGSGKPVFSVPTFRVDLEREIDLIEEVARVHGYNNIEISQRSKVDLKQSFPVTNPVDRIRRTLIGFGYKEALSLSLTSAERSFAGPVEPASVLNAQNREMSVLRTSLVPGLLTAVAYNQDFGSTDVRLFEIGNVFAVDRTSKHLVGDFLEEERICLISTGASQPPHWKSASRSLDFFDMKGDVKSLLDGIVLDKSRFISYSTTETLCDDALAIEINGSYAGYLGKIKSGVLRSFGLEQDVFVAELSSRLLKEARPGRYSPLPRFPRVQRDLAVVVQASIEAARVQEVIDKSSSSLVASAQLFDLYEGEKLGPGLKSLAFRIEFVSPERTLKDEEVDLDVKKIVGALERELQATLRSV